MGDIVQRYIVVVLEGILLFGGLPLLLVYLLGSLLNLIASLFDLIPKFCSLHLDLLRLFLHLKDDGFCLLLYIQMRCVLLEFGLAFDSVLLASQHCFHGSIGCRNYGLRFSVPPAGACYWN